MRISRTLAAIGLVVTLLVSCRSTRPEAGLPPAAYVGQHPRVVANERGLWFIVTDGTSPQNMPFVALGEGESRELFYAIWVGRRTARLMPVTPFAYSLLDSVRDQPVEASWASTPGEVELPDSLGWLADARTAPQWVGPTPRDGTAVTLVAGRLDQVPRVQDWIAGTAEVRDGKLVSVQLDDANVSGPWIALPDGVVPARPLRAALTGLEVSATEGLELRPLSESLTDSSRFVARPAALRAGVDAVVRAAEFDGAHITLARPILRHGLELSVTEDPLVVRRTEVADGLLALRDIAAGRDLAAAGRLLALNAEADRQRGARPMRMLELVAAAGYVDWTRDALVADADGLGPDIALYLARSHFVGGDIQRAIDFTMRAAERFGGWPEPGRSHGAARARLLNARLHGLQGEWDVAFNRAIEAADWFETASDSMRAAETELLAAHFAANAQDLSRAVQAAALARSRFFHGKSPYHAAFAELALADFYTRAGEPDEAAKLTEFARLRFEELGDPVGRNRVRITNGRVASVKSPSQGVRDLQFGLEQAQASGDFVGVVDAAASLVVLGGAPRDATAGYGLVIAAGMVRTSDPYVRERAAQALTLLCGRGMADLVERVSGASARDIAIAKAACTDDGSAPAGTENTAVAALIAQGWAAQRGGNADEANVLASKLEGSATDELWQTAPMQAARALFLAAVIARDGDLAGADELTLRGVRRLSDHVDPARLASTLDELAAEYVTRGQIWLGADLLRAAMTVAAEQNQTELRRAIAQRRVEILHAAGDYDGALSATYDAQPVLETAGADSLKELAALWLIQADALLRLNRATDAAIAQKKATEAIGALEPLAQVSLTLRQFELVVARGDTEAARAALARAERLEGALGEGLATDEARRLLRAEILVARADLELRQGSVERAANDYVAALDAVADLGTTAEVLQFRIGALSGLGRATGNDDRLQSTIEGLEALRGTNAEDFPSVVGAATAALARLHILAGQPSRAFDILEAAQVDGVAAAENPREMLCLRARAAGLSGRDGATTMLERCAAASQGDERADAALLAALLDPQSTAPDKNRAARKILADTAGISAREKARLEFVSELAAGLNKPDEKREQRLSGALAKAIEQSRAAAAVTAIEALVAYYVETGQAPRAAQVVDEHSGTFYEIPINGPGALARARAQATVGLLEPVAAHAFASRAHDETPDLTAQDEVGLRLASAQSTVLLGMWQAARSNVQLARAAAGRDSGLLRQIDAFARRFAIP